MDLHIFCLLSRVDKPCETIPAFLQMAERSVWLNILSLPFATTIETTIQFISRPMASSEDPSPSAPINSQSCSDEDHQNHQQNQILQRATPRENNDSSFFSWFSWSLNQDNHHKPDPPQNPPHPHPQQNNSSGWFSWFSSNPPEPESDADDSDAAELLRNARSTIETAKDSLHYSLVYLSNPLVPFSSQDSYLSVAETHSAHAPVICPPRKIPQSCWEVLEQALVKNPPPPPQPITPPPNGTPNSTQETPKAVSTADSAMNSSTLQSAPRKLPSPTAPEVWPSLDHNLRHITWKTRIRLYGEKVVSGQGSSEKHLYRNNKGAGIPKKSRDPPTKVTIISMHTFLPHKFVKSYLGQSSGNARSLGEKTAQAVKSWFDAHHGPSDITTICLEGRGTFQQRAEESMKLLRNWSKSINESKAVFFVANSIAVPAAVFLMNLLFHEGSIDLHHKNIGFLAIAGTNCGVFAGIESKVVVRAYTQSENEMIKELFDLRRPNSEMARVVREKWDDICQRNVKISLFGSLTDQMVPLYSSTHSAMRHPNMYKSIFVGGEKNDVPPFVSKLLLTVMIMENCGYGDQSMVKDLSDYIQGAVNGVSGTHGRIISNEEVFYVGVRFTMETTRLVQPRHIVQDRGGSDFEGQQPDKNLYHIPWNVRGLINDLLHIKNIQNLEVLNELVKSYKAWEPSNKVWRELKFSFAAFDDICLDELIL